MKLPYNDTKIVTTKTGRPNNKYTIISVDNETHQSEQVTVEGIHFKLQISKFDKDFKQKLENGGNLIIYNLPSDINEVDLTELVSQYANVQNVRLNQESGKDAQMAYVLFNTKQEAQEVMNKINGLYLDTNQITCKLYQSIQERIQQNCDILINDIDLSVSKQQVLDVIQGFIKPGAILTFKDNGYKKQAIFTCKDKQSFNEFISKYSNKQLKLNGVECTVLEKLNKTMQKYLQEQQQQEKTVE